MSVPAEGLRSGPAPRPNAASQLFFDLDMSGHHPEFLYHLVRYRLRHPDAPPLLLATHPDCPARLGHFPAPPQWPVPGVEFLYPTPQELASLAAAGSAASRAAIEFRIVRRLADAHRVEQVCLLCMDKFQFVLGTAAARRASWRVSGILIHPLQPERSRHRSALVRWRKYLQLAWMLRNRQVHRVCVLNNERVAAYLNGRFRRQGLFVAVPDPVMPVDVPAPPPVLSPGSAAVRGVCATVPLTAGPTPVSARDLPSVGPETTTFLVFGHLCRRKGVYLVLEALRLLPAALPTRPAVVFAGHVESTEREAFLGAVAAVRRDRPEVTVEVVDRFVEYRELGELFGRVDCVLVPYVGMPEGSSGVLGHAALFGKLVIGPDVGLVADLIRGYGLGATIAGGQPAPLAAAMAAACRPQGLGADRAGMARYVAERDPDEFVRLLLAGPVLAASAGRGGAG